MDEVVATPRARLRVAPDPGSGGLVATLGGELDVAGVADVAAPLEELLAREVQPLLVDLADLRFLDSSGVAVLIRLANRFSPVRTRAAAPPVRRVIEVLGLADRLGLDGA
ncbi:STAS domain-containing protein [Geodermatophilus sp. SYSU D01186]